RGAATTTNRREYSLLAHDRDAFEHLTVSNGFLELRGLAVGDYQLTLHETGDAVHVRVTAGQRDGDWLVGSERVLRAGDNTPLDLGSGKVEVDDLLIQLATATTATRVHVIATRALPAFDLFDDLRGAGAPPLTVAVHERSESSYEAGRKLGDEYRYV